MTTLVPAAQQDDDSLEALGARVARLAALHDERAAEVERVRTGLEAFRLRYRQEVGGLHEQLDALELAIAEAELGELTKKLEHEESREPALPTAAPPEPLPRFTSDAVRKLFRDVAKTIHPDLADDEATRNRRHALMVEANRAYALGDEQHLRSILQAWERSPEAVQGSDPDAMRLRFCRRIVQIEEHLTALAAELEALKGSSLWELKVMVDQAAIRGKDIVADMVRRLTRDIMAARNRLEAMGA